MTLNKTTIDASHDPMGSAISDYYKNGRACTWQCVGYWCRSRMPRACVEEKGI